MPSARCGYFFSFLFYISFLSLLYILFCIYFFFLILNNVSSVHCYDDAAAYANNGCCLTVVDVPTCTNVCKLIHTQQQRPIQKYLLNIKTIFFIPILCTVFVCVSSLCHCLFYCNLRFYTLKQNKRKKPSRQLKNNHKYKYKNHHHR